MPPDLPLELISMLAALDESVRAASGAATRAKAEWRVVERRDWMRAQEARRAEAGLKGLSKQEGVPSHSRHPAPRRGPRAWRAACAAVRAELCAAHGLLARQVSYTVVDADHVLARRAAMVDSIIEYGLTSEQAIDLLSKHHWTRSDVMDQIVDVAFANDSAIESSTGPLTAPHASLSERQPRRMSTHRQPKAIGSSAASKATCCWGKVCRATARSLASAAWRCCSDALSGATPCSPDRRLRPQLL